MATELVHSATSESLSDIDWSKNIGICELVAQDNRQAKDVIKAIKKRLDHKNQKVQLYSVSLLEMLMNNIGEPIHKQVMDVGLLPLLVKLVKKKSDSPVREKIFLLLDATQTSVGGSKGRFPHYYNAFYELVNAGVQFPGQQYTVSSNAPSPGTRQINLTVREAASATANKERNPPPPPPAAAAAERPKDQAPPGSSIIEKATAALEVLREVLDAVNPGNPEAGKDEFTLDLVEQCSFQKQRVMHLVMTSRDERLLSQAIELNEKLGRVLARHDALLYNKPQSLSNSDPIEHKITSPSQGRDFAIQPSSRPNPVLNDVVIGHEEDEEDEAEQLSRRMRKGKARAKPDDYEEENTSVARPFGWLDSSTHTNNLHRPLIRPLSQDPLQSSDEPVAKPLINPAAAPPPGFSIPPPPSKHMEREKFFQEKKGDSDSLSGRMSGLSLHSRNPSSSYSERSFDSCE